MTETSVIIPDGYVTVFEGSNLQVVFAVYLTEEAAASLPALLPPTHLLSITLGAVSALQLALGAVVMGIQLYSPPTVSPTMSTIFIVPLPTLSPSPTPPPLAHRAPTAAERDGSAVTVLLSLLTVLDVSGRGLVSYVAPGCPGGY